MPFKKKEQPVEPRPPEFQPWEVVALDAVTAERIRNFLRLEEGDPIPVALRKVLTTYNAEQRGEHLEESISEATLKWLVQLAELKYPSTVPIPIKAGAIVHSVMFNQDVIFAERAPLDRALINRNGNFHIVPISDLVTNEFADPDSQLNNDILFGATSRAQLESVAARSSRKHEEAPVG